MYGTRAKNFGVFTGGFDVYISTDLKNWSKPCECFNSNEYNMNIGVNWAPEVHKYNGAVCYVRLSDDLRCAVGKPVTLFRAADPKWVKRKIPFKHYITDGPFMLKTKNNTLLMIWSTFIEHKYAECVVMFNEGTVKGGFEHLEPLIDDDGGHGMIFTSGEKLCLTYHTPNTKGHEHPTFTGIEDNGDSIYIKK